MNKEADKRDPKSFAVIDAAMEGHNEPHFGFLEGAYCDAPEAEFKFRGIPSPREAVLPVYYKGVVLRCHDRADVVCVGDLIIEPEALKTNTGAERAQVINYLKATGCRVAILLNFGTTGLEFETIVLSQS